MNIILWIAIGVALVAVVAVLAWRARRPREREIFTLINREGHTVVEAPSIPAGASAAAAPPAGATATAAGAPPPLQRVDALALGIDTSAGAPYSPGPAAMQLLMNAGQEFARIGTEPRYTPRRPSLLPQLLEAVQDEGASLKALSRIISQDPALTGELLRTANSALYRVSGTPVESVERASAMLGTQGLRTLIAAALVKPLSGASVQGQGRFGEVTWEHSLYSASAAEAWAARSQDCDPFTAHLLGLMYGLGAVAVYRVMTDLYAKQGIGPDPAVIGYALETQAAVTAKRIAASWGLSERTQEALEAQSAAAPALTVTPLTRALAFGRLAGALIVLCRHQLLGEAEGTATLNAAGYQGQPLDRIWDRLLRAYVRP